MSKIQEFEQAKEFYDKCLNANLKRLEADWHWWRGQPQDDDFVISTIKQIAENILDTKLRIDDNSQREYEEMTELW